MGFRLLAGVADLLIVLLLGTWLVGGIEWDGRLLLRHGADPRRAALLLGLVVALLPRMRDRSIVYEVARSSWRSLHRPVVRWSVLFAVMLWASVQGALQTLALRYPMVDVGIFHQVISGAARGDGWRATITGVGSFWSDHFSPSLALLAPLFWISDYSPLTLPIVHAILVFGGGVAAWVFLAERIPALTDERRQRLAAAVIVFAISFDSLWANLRWGFHESAIAFACQSWAWAILLIRAWGTRGVILAMALMLISAGSKEILLLDGMVALTLIAWSERGMKSRATMLLSLIAAVACAVAFALFTSEGSDEKKNYFVRYYSYLGGDARSMVWALLSRPWLVLEQVGASELVRFAWTVLVPWLGLPLLWWVGDRGEPRPRVGIRSSYVLAAILPSVLAMALSTVPWLRRADHHYVFNLWPLLASLTIFALARIRSRHALVVWAFLTMLSLGQDPWRSLIDHVREADRTAPVRAELERIPRGASVMADEMTGTWLADRHTVARWPDLKPFGVSCPDWLVLSPTAVRDVPGPVSFSARCQVTDLGSGWVVSPVTSR